MDYVLLCQQHADLDYVCGLLWRYWSCLHYVASYLYTVHSKLTVSI